VRVPYAIDPTAYDLARKNDVMHALPRDRLEGDSRIMKLASWLTDMPRTHSFNLRMETGGRCNTKHPCGSQACAVGSTPMVFPGLVRTIVKQRGSKWEADGVAIVSLRKRRGGSRPGVKDFSRVAQVLFGVPHKTAVDLFGFVPGVYDSDGHLGNYDDPMVVVRRIENYFRDRYSV